MAEDIILGIDLGTTFSAMAYVDKHGKPVIVPNSEGQTTTPSVIHFYGPDACVVGEEAVKAVVLDPDNVVRFVKRHMGEPGYSLEYFGRSYSAQELSALILKKLKEDAEAALGFPVRDAVITVPAYFNSPQRGATAEAGALAGFNVLSIINEPTAAAIAYGVDRLGGRRKMMVFDLGGGTFDVTVMEINGNSLRTLATEGNAELGGKDWDDKLLAHVAETFSRQFGMDPLDDPQVHQELYERVLSAKIALSNKQRVVIPVNYAGNRTVVIVTRDEFEELSRDLVDQCADTASLVLERAKLRWVDIDDILFAGGSTRMPAIHALVNRLSGRGPAGGLNPDECVAHGAALAGVFRHRPNHPAIQKRPGREAFRNLPGDTPSLPPGPPQGGLPSGVSIVDVATHPLGIVALDGGNREQIVTLIPQGVPLPFEKRRRFAYAYDNLTAVRVEVTEGVGENRDEVTVIGEVILDNLPPRPRGTPIEVVYRYTVNNILEVDVIDVETRAARKARITLKGGLSPREMEAAMHRVAIAAVH
ncbi:MAG TPA: Hsp70 family protein [Myxococcota bacterium]|nr:Hsp70 family protein [Myxococcota bacterium]